METDRSMSAPYVNRSDPIDRVPRARELNDRATGIAAKAVSQSTMHGRRGFAANRWGKVGREIEEIALRIDLVLALRRSNLECLGMGRHHRHGDLQRPHRARRSAMATEGSHARATSAFTLPARDLEPRRQIREGRSV